MSHETVLYDAPGPVARRRALAGTVVAAAGLLALIGVAMKRLADKGQFDMEKWGPLVDPSHESFARVWELLGGGLRNTLVSAVLAILLSLAVGVVLGTARMMLPRSLRIPVVTWIELFRGLPVVITIFLVWRLLVESGVDLEFLPGEEGLWFLVIGLTLYNSVIIAEILRSGVASLPRGQGEAGRAIGLTEAQVMRSILLPQAFRVMLPALISQLVVVLKDTSLAAIFAFYIELLKQGELLARALDNRLQVLTVVGVVFILINYALSRLAVWTEKSLSSRGTVTEEEMDAAQAQGGTAGA